MTSGVARHSVVVWWRDRWHIRYSGRDLFVKCDERELLPIFTAEADQLELLSRSKTVTVPEVLAVGSDRDYSFLVSARS